MGELALGFRFYPTEDELVSFYLHNMLESNDKKPHISRVIPILDIYQHDPWQLPKHCGELCHGDTEQWFFFMPRQEREVRGGRPSRTTGSGYWKATGSPSYVFSSESKVIAVKKNMVFYKGKAPTGTKTKWKMNEYRAIKHDSCTSIPRLRHEVSLCRVYVVSGSSRAFDRRPIHVADDQTFPPTGSVKINDAEEDRVKTGAGLQQRSCSSGSSFSEGNCINMDKMILNSCLDNLMEWDDVN